MVLIVDDVSVVYPAANGRPPVEALRKIDLTMDRNDFVVALGASGCGKSTLLNLLAGFLSPSSGSIRLDGAAVTGPGADRSVVFQKHALMPWLNVRDNVAFGLKMQDVPPRERYATAEKYIALLGLDGFQGSPVYQLSGGMQQRVGIARALHLNPDILLMDEPFSALDALTREEMGFELLRIWESQPKTVLFITHSISEAVLLADRVLVMSGRPGTVAEDLAIDIPRPRGVETTGSKAMQDYSGYLRNLLLKREA